MSYGHKGVGMTQEERDMWEPIGEKPWPLRLAIPATLRFIGRGYMWGCTVGFTAFIIYAIVHYIDGG